jgi:hypothetical protein
MGLCLGIESEDSFSRVIGDDHFAFAAVGIHCFFLFF